MNEIEGHFTCTPPEIDLSLQISTENGVIQGQEEITDNGTTYISFQGIPFAQPPINELRFRSPVPTSNWRGVLDATRSPPGCIELHFEMEDLLMSTTGSEDCLYLNIYVPKAFSTRNTSSIPVIFWIYGGGFIEGNATFYQPDYLVEQDLIVVIPNYRMGVLGFLSTQDEASPGNVGLRDQNMALKWVKKNIEKFGGDPERITIAGQSAGASSVMYHILAPKSRGLFSRAIAMSGDTNAIWTRQILPRKIAFDVGLSLGIETDNSTELVERLRVTDLERINNVLLLVFIANGYNFLENGLIFAPVIEPNSEDAFITHSSLELMTRGYFHKVPLMIGTTNMEFPFLSVGSFKILVRPLLLLWDVSPSSFPNWVDKDSFTKIKRTYFSTNSFTSATDEEVNKFISDAMFTVPITNTVRLMFSHMPVYFYVFAYSGKNVKKYMQNFGLMVDPSLNGAVHGEDLSYIWKFMNISMPSDDLPMNRRMVKLWSNFATYGNPTPVPDAILDNITWPAVPTKSKIPYLEIGKRLKVRYNYRKKFIDLWNNLPEVMSH